MSAHPQDTGRFVVLREASAEQFFFFSRVFFLVLSWLLKGWPTYIVRDPQNCQTGLLFWKDEDNWLFFPTSDPEQPESSADDVAGAGLAVPA